MKSVTSLIILMLINICCHAQQDDNDTISENTYFEMFVKASGKTQRGDTIFQVFSMAPYYVVITVTDLKTGLTKELCVEYYAIESAIQKDGGNAEINEKKRLFKFKSDEALRTVGFFTFSHDKMAECLDGITTEYLKKKWKEDYINFTNTFSGECQKYYAYLLFKNGIMSKRGSVASGLTIDINPND